MIIFLVIVVIGYFLIYRPIFTDKEAASAAVAPGQSRSEGNSGTAAASANSAETATTSQPAAAKEAAELLTQAKRVQESGDSAGAQTSFEEVVKKYPDTWAAKQAHFELGARERGTAAPGQFYRASASGLPVVNMGGVTVTTAREAKGDPPSLDVFYGSGDGALDLGIKQSDPALPVTVFLAPALCGGSAPRRVEVLVGRFARCELVAYNQGGEVVGSAAPEAEGEWVTLRSESGIRRVAVIGAKICIAQVKWSCREGIPAGVDFVRGDANVDGGIDIGDAITILSMLFARGGVKCRDAADTNDDGALDIADAISLLSYLYADGASPPPPGNCSEDPTPDRLDCESFRICSP